MPPERSAALKGIMRWVRLRPYNIAKKVEIVVEHYRENVQPLLEGAAKAILPASERTSLLATRTAPWNRRPAAT